MSNIIITNLEQVGIGILLFMLAYVSNIGLGAWKNVKIEGCEFEWELIFQSIIKFIVLIFSIGCLSISISIIPIYATYIGIDIGAETMETMDSLVIIGAFLSATITYVKDAISKLQTIFTK